MSQENVESVRQGFERFAATGQERLGHATIAITLDTYSHAIPAMQEDAAEKIAALLER